MSISVEEARRALRFDRRQAEVIADFLAEQLSHGGAISFRLMLDVFPECLDLTSYGRDGVELTHIHPRGSSFLMRPPAAEEPA